MSALRREEDAAARVAHEKGVGIEKGSFTYDTEPATDETSTGDADNDAEPNFALRDIDVHFPEGKLSLVCGPTGSGKTSLFLALLGGAWCPFA